MKEQKYKELSKKEFTRAAEIYDNENAGIYNTCHKNYPRIMEIIKKEKTENLLDVGCGTGLMEELISKELPSCHMTGLDLTEKMIEKASEKKIPLTSFIVGDAENLPFDDKTFDTVLCMESFHHYPHPDKFLSETERVLKNGGRLILLDYCAGGIAGFLINKIEMPLVHLFGHGDVGIVNKKKLYRLADEASLSVESFAKKHVKMTVVLRKK